MILSSICDESLKSMHAIFTNDSIGVPKVVSVELMLSIDFLGIPTKPWNNTRKALFRRIWNHFAPKRLVIDQTMST